MPETELGGPPVIEVPDSESISKDEEYRQNAKRCQRMLSISTAWEQ